MTDFTRRFAPLKLPSGTSHPALLYGTAFKGEQTGHFTALGLKNGFKGFDTANYPTAYSEPQSGAAISAALKGGTRRESLFVQTKFTPAWAHAEGKLPYDGSQPLADQVRESIEQSFANLQVDYIDALLLHVPYDDKEDNITAWRVMESYVPHRIGALGVSNTPLDVLKMLHAAAKSEATRPVIVQNRFQASSGYDIALREWLDAKGGLYQAFHLLKTNEEVLASELLANFSQEFGVPKEVAFYLLVLGLGNVSIVDGTASEEHMRVDLEAVGAVLGDETKVQAARAYLGQFETLLRAVAAEEAE